MSNMKKKLAVVLTLFFVCCKAEKQNSEERIIDILVRLEYRLNRMENKLNRVNYAPVKIYTDCPDSWIRFKESCYLFEEKKYSFFNARSYCQHLGADLVHINDFPENEFIRRHLKSLKSIHFWIGLEDTDTEGIFKWVDDNTTPAFTGWDYGQPSNYAGREDCANFKSDYNYNWNDSPCYYSYGSICEMKAKV